MKKLLLMLSLAGCITIAYTQDMEAKKMSKKINDKARVAVGLNSSNITGESSYKSILGILIGLETPILNFSETAGLGIGIAYSMQGGKYKSMGYETGGTYGSSSSTNTRLNYLNLPVLMRYQKKPVGMFAELGLQPGLLLSAKDGSENIKSDLKKFDMGVPIGAGYNFKNNFGVGLRFTPGLLNINKNTEYKNRNMVGSLRATYAF